MSEPAGKAAWQILLGHAVKGSLLRAYWLGVSHFLSPETDQVYYLAGDQNSTGQQIKDWKVDTL